ncbi:MAG: Crp/Fnr family transcriptional regulator [Polyangiales bacterium]
MKTSERVREQLRRTWLFAELSEAELDTLERIATRRRFERGDVIVHQGDTEGTDLYCVLKGHLKVTRCDRHGDELLINVLHPGALIGEIALLDGDPRSATVTGLDAGEVLAIRRADFFRILNLSPQVGIGSKLLVTMARRIRHLTERVHENSSLAVPTRVAKRLNELADLVGTSIDAQRVILNIKLSQQELGDMVQATRESVNKCLRALERAGIIERTGGRIVILDRQRLRALIAA